MHRAAGRLCWRTREVFLPLFASEHFHGLQKASCSQYTECCLAYSFYGVFDGHEGAAAAEFAATELHKYVALELQRLKYVLSLSPALL